MKLVLGLITLISLSINLILMYTLSWNPFAYYLNQPELSSIPYSTRTFAIQIWSIGTIILIWGSFIYSVVKSLKSKRNNYLSLTLSLMFFAGLMILNWTVDTEDHYSYSASTEGYEYMEKYWYVKGDTLFEKWKSALPYDSKLPREQTVWILIDTNKK